MNIDNKKKKDFLSDLIRQADKIVVRKDKTINRKLFKSGR